MQYIPLSSIPLQLQDPVTSVNMSGGSLEFYLAGTSTPTNLFSDTVGTSIGSSIALNSGGFPESGGNVVNLHYDADVPVDIAIKNAAGLEITPRITVRAPTGRFMLSDAEDSAGLTQDDIDSDYPEGNLRRFKCALDGVTDDTVGLTNAALVGGFLYGEGGTLLFDPNISFAVLTHLKGYNGFTLKPSGASTTGGCMDFAEAGSILECNIDLVNVDDYQGVTLTGAGCTFIGELYNMKAAAGASSGNIAGVTCVGARCKVNVLDSSGFANTGATNASFPRCVNINAGSDDTEVKLFATNGNCGVVCSNGVVRPRVEIVAGTTTDNDLYDLGSIDGNFKVTLNQLGEEGAVFKNSVRPTVNLVAVIGAAGSSGTIGLDEGIQDMVIEFARITDVQSSNRPSLIRVRPGNDKTITGITQANPGVITLSNADDLENGQFVTISGVVGMTEINSDETAGTGLYVITNLSGLTCQLTDRAGNAVDTSAFTAYTSDGTLTVMPHVQGLRIKGLDIESRSDTVISLANGVVDDFVLSDGWSIKQHWVDAGQQQNIIDHPWGNSFGYGRGRLTIIDDVGTLINTDNFTWMVPNAQITKPSYVRGLDLLLLDANGAVDDFGFRMLGTGQALISLSGVFLDSSGRPTEAPNGVQPSRVAINAAPSGIYVREDTIFDNVDPDEGDPAGWAATVTGVEGSGGVVVPFGQQGYRSRAGSPVSNFTPRFVGERVFDTTAEVWYSATGTAITDWKQDSA